MDLDLQTGSTCIEHSSLTIKKSADLRSNHDNPTRSSEVDSGQQHSDD